MHFVLNAIGTVKQKSVHLLFICLGVGLFVGNKACSFVLPQMSVLVGGLRRSCRILFQQASGVVTRMQACFSDRPCMNRFQMFGTFS